jgi:hypothetical protein
MLAPRTGTAPKEPEHPEHWSFPKLTNPAFAREQAELERLSRKLKAQIEPGHGETPGQGIASDDPFGHLRNKERADELIGQSVERFCATLGERALGHEACRDVTLAALTRMVGKVQRDGALLTEKDVAAFSGPQTDEEGNMAASDIELGFATSFRIYADSQGQEDYRKYGRIAKGQLKNFIKSALDL